MTEAKQDTARALAAGQAILDGRGADDAASIMVTLEHAVATVLVALYRNHTHAAAILNKGLVPGVEARIALHQTRSQAGRS